ncbi:MAG: carbohydrate ABC transporter permease [Anaerolineae bacterium]|nr:carbohydrate ABC transporter permease [Anaerolineae bacterium]MDW8099750.1 carbohydrate ABC transporter permease [Anaerolineae bacterium]
MRRRITVRRVLLYAVLIIGSAIMAFPMAFAISGSLCDLEDFYARPWFPYPTKVYLENYRILFTPKFTAQVQIWRWIANTLVRIVWYTLIPGTVAVLAGYVFARLRFRGRDAAFMYLLSSMMIPGIVYLIPTYIIMARFPGAGGNDWRGQGGHGFINEWPALLIPGLVNVFYIFMLRQTFYTIPTDFEEAARVDGASTLRCLKDVYLPMLKPTLTVLVIFQFVAIWNDYQWPLIVSAGNRKIWTVALGFQQMLFVGASYKGYPPGSAIVDYPFSFAMAVIATLPLILLFLALQRYFVEGVQGFAIKG